MCAPGRKAQGLNFCCCALYQRKDRSAYCCISERLFEAIIHKRGVGMINTNRQLEICVCTTGKISTPALEINVKKRKNKQRGQTPRANATQTNTRNSDETVTCLCPSRYSPRAFWMCDISPSCLSSCRRRFSIDSTYLSNHIHQHRNSDNDGWINRTLTAAVDISSMEATDKALHFGWRYFCLQPDSATSPHSSACSFHAPMNT